MAGSDVGDPEEVAKFFRDKFGQVKAIQVRGNPRAVILKATDGIAAEVKRSEGGYVVQGTRLVPVLTSGAVGNLKRRASEAGSRWPSS